MAKKKSDEVKKPDDPKSFSAFLKKRAPVYLGIIGLFMIFAYPALTEKNLESLLADDSFHGNEKIAVEMVKFYKGSNDTGISVLEAIEGKINDKYPDEKIFNDEDTWAEFIVGQVNEKVYQVVFTFNVKNDQSLSYEWHANIEDGEIYPRDDSSKTIMHVVDYYD